MTTLNILVAPHKILSTKADSVQEINAEVKQLVNDMIETMIEDRAIGLAANQVGILKRVIVMNVGDDNSLTGELNSIEPKTYSFINPEVVWESEEKTMFEEGCMSIPGQGVKIKRSTEVKLKFLDLEGVEHVEHFKGLQARCVLHELDHLNGITMLDYLSKLKRSFAEKKLMKHYKG